MSLKIVNWIHTAIVKPILLYGVSIWWPALMKQTTTTNLNKVQRMASLCISGALRTTPDEALNAILNLPSLDLAGMERAKIAAVRMRDLGQWKPQIYGQYRSILPDHCSVFQAEVFAIIEALMLLNDANCQNKLIKIYSDSQAAIRSIISTNTNSHTISNCRKSLHEMALQFKIYLIWVPGHRNITGNCIADELARHGTTVPLLPDKENIGMPMAT
ncbi:uncharacterized protein [Drosophila suzukii]|uniref:RNase H type-1 domain-containing protein n=1 Tax=Drosophila suzukii TaxID=28584 RepID=A0ABM4TW32_DROSZ